MARDCTVNKGLYGSAPSSAQPINPAGFDSEYANLMAELGETPAANEPPKSWSAGHDVTAGGANIPPWRRPEVWAQPAPLPQQQYQPHVAGYGGYSGAGGYGNPVAWQGYGQPQDASNYAAYYQGQYAQQQVS